MESTGDAPRIPGSWDTSGGGKEKWSRKAKLTARVTGERRDDRELGIIYHPPVYRRSSLQMLFNLPDEKLSFVPASAFRSASACRFSATNFLFVARFHPRFRRRAFSRVLAALSFPFLHHFSYFIASLSLLLSASAIPEISRFRGNTFTFPRTFDASPLLATHVTLQRKA